jgi:hypothetical protein
VALEAEAAFRALCRKEQGLAELEREIRAVRDNGGRFCANDAWYSDGGFNWRLCGLVGRGAAQAELRDSTCYDTAYDFLYGLLPDCRGCRCIAIEKAIGLSRRRRHV